MKLKQATARIEDAGLSVGRVDRLASEDDAKGRVIAQDPDPLTLLDPGSEVDLTVSTGSPDVVVPYVVGKSRDVARQILEDAGLEVKMVKEQSDEPRDVVVRTDPEPAANVSKGSEVKVYYSAGPKEVPSVVGMSQDKATRVLKKAGFEVDVTYDSETVAERGQVLKQSPEAYTEQPQGTRILLTVSSYEEPSPTPTPTPSPSETVEPSPSPSESSGPLG
jgi:serine/threonine-protein kinase